MLCRGQVRRARGRRFCTSGFLLGEIRNVELPEGSVGAIAVPDVNGGVISKGRPRSLAEAATEREPLVERYPRRLASIRW